MTSERAVSFLRTVACHVNVVIVNIFKNGYTKFVSRYNEKNSYRRFLKEYFQENWCVLNFMRQCLYFSLR